MQNRSPRARALALARYGSKYLKKDIGNAPFNRKSYWASRSIVVEPRVVQWLDSVSLLSAASEAAKLYGVPLALQWWFSDDGRVGQLRLPDAWDPEPPF
jgi:hypothetical protein